MKSYRHALACISASKKFAVNFIRWDRRGRWRNNPARVLRIFEKLSVHADVDYYGLNQGYSDEVETYHYHNDKFPRSYFDGCWLPDAKSVTTYLREWQLIREKDKAECETELLKGLADAPLELLYGFRRSPSIVFRYPYCDYLDGTGALDVGRFIDACSTTLRDVRLSSQGDRLQQLVDYEKADKAQRLNMLQNEGMLFCEAAAFAAGDKEFETGTLPAPVISAYFRGLLRVDDGVAVMEVGEAVWFLTFEDTARAAKRLNVATAVVTEAMKCLGLASGARRRGRIFYDAAVVNRYRRSDKRLFGGLVNKDFEVLSQYTAFDFNPWANDHL